MKVTKAGGEKFNIEGRLFDEANLKMVIDGYTGELTTSSSHFVDYSEVYFPAVSHFLVHC